MTEEKGKVEEKPLMFKVNAVGLDTTNLNYPSSLEPGEYEYIHINFGSNNDEFTSDLVKTSRIFMTVKFLDHIQNAVMSYLKRNGIRNLNCILVDSKCNFEKDVDQLKGLIDLGIVAESSVGISQPESVERLEEISKILRFDYISLNICPLSFNAEVVKWAQEHDKKIVGFNPFGGQLSFPNIIESFTVPYLLGFIATYAEYIFLSSRDLVYSSNEKYYLESLIGEKSEKLYLFTKSLNKLVQPIKKAIKNYLLVDEESVIEVEDPTFGFDKRELVISTTDIKIEVIPEPQVVGPGETPTPEKFINGLYVSEETDSKPEGIDDESYLALLKYRIIDALEKYFNKRYGEFKGSCTVLDHKLCRNAVIITAEVDYIERSGIFTVDRRAESYNFILYYKNGKFLFRKVLAKD